MAKTSVRREDPARPVAEHRERRRTEVFMQSDHTGGVTRTNRGKAE